MNKVKIVYWIVTGIMCLIFLFSASMYLLKYEMVKGFYENLGFPTWIIYPLAIAKLLGIAAVLSGKSKLLKEWAYAGFFFDGVLAFSAHYYAGDGGYAMAGIAILATITSRLYDAKIN